MKIFFMFLLLNAFTYKVTALDGKTHLGVNSQVGFNR